MEAGRELDMLVAEKVMGWSDFEDHYPLPWYGMSSYGIRDIVPFYSAKIADAWQVVEQMTDHRLDLVQIIKRLTHGQNAGQLVWRAKFLGPSFGEAQADTAPHAICLAALEVIK